MHGSIHKDCVVPTKVGWHADPRDCTASALDGAVQYPPGAGGGVALGFLPDDVGDAVLSFAIGWLHGRAALVSRQALDL
jgi:hypothetical protein